MRKIVVLVALLAVILICSTVYAIPGDIVGDVNGDGKITTLDLAAIQRHIIGMKQLDNIHLADVNYDDMVNSVDIAFVMRYILGVL